MSKIIDFYKHRPVDVRRRLGITDRQLGNCFDKCPDRGLVDTDTPNAKNPREVLRIGRQRLFSDINVDYIQNNLLRKQQIV